MSADWPGRLPAPLVRGVQLSGQGQGLPRVDAVLRGLRRFRRLDAQPLSDGLSPQGARLALDQAVAAISREGLERALQAGATRPARVGIVVARGVFTSPLEWAALYAAAGSRVHLKAPSGAPEAALALAACLAREGLPVSAGVDRDLRRSLDGEPDRVLAFGADPTVGDLAASWPPGVVAAYGHRFGAAVVGGEADPLAVAALARDHALYDTRGCMAPSLVLIVAPTLAEAEGRAERWGQELARAMEQEQLLLPRGVVDPSLGPEWRRRLGLSRARGRLWQGSAWAVTVLPLASAVPVALPRLAALHPLAESDLGPLVRGWSPHLGSLAMDAAASVRHAGLVLQVPHRCRLGELQTPPFPRAHDGRPMLP